MSSTPQAQQKQEISRQDQIVYRFYLKTVGVLVDGRLTDLEVFGGGKGREVKVDKWFNLPLPDPDLFRQDLAPYKTLSLTYPSFPLPPPSSPSIPPPPLLIAFTLDFSDLLLPTAAGRRLMYRSPSGRDIPLDAASLASLTGKGKGRDTGDVKGIILEQWTLLPISPYLPTPPPTQPPPTSTSSSSTSSLSASLTSLPSSSSSLPARPTQPYTPPSSSAAYKSGIIHFRALYQYLRSLPAFDLSRRIHSGGNEVAGLKMGVKMWCAEGWGEGEDVTLGSGSSGDGRGGGRRTVRRAWGKMEAALLPLSVDLEGEGKWKVEEYSFPSVPLSNALFNLSISSRPSIDFWVDSPQLHPIPQTPAEPILDLEEEYFTPTLARKRLESISIPTSTSSSPFRPSSLPTTGLSPPLAGITLAQRGGLSATRPPTLDPSLPRRSTDSAPVSGQVSPIGALSGSPSSFPLSGSREVGGSSGSLRRWQGLGLAGEGGLPFAVQGRESPILGGGGERLRTSSFGDRSSPIPTGSLARRLSTQSTQRARPGFFDQPSSPSSPGPILRHTPPGPSFTRGGNSYEPRPGLSSLPRPSSLLSQSGRSFTQLSEARARLQDYSPGVPQPGGSGSFKSPSPISGSFTRSTGLPTPISALPRPPLASHPTSPAPLPPFAEEQGSENEATPGAGSSPRTTPQMIKRYSSSFGQRNRSGSGPVAGSSGSSMGDQGSLLGRSGGSGLGIGMGAGARRMSGRGSYEGLGGVGRLGGSQSGRVSGSVAPVDGDDINLFLKTLDNMPRPPSLAVSRSPAHLPITSSALSVTSPTTGSSTPARSSGSSGSPSVGSLTLPMTSSAMMKKPLTRTQVDDTLRRMAGSYTVAGPPFPQPSVGGTSSSGSVTITRRPSTSSRIQSFTPASMEDSSSPQAESINPPRSLTSREITSLASRTSLGSSVKSSSPLAGAPLFAPPPSAPSSPARHPQPPGSPSPSRSPSMPLQSPAPLTLPLPLPGGGRVGRSDSGIQSLPSGGVQAEVLGSSLGRPRKSSQPDEVMTMPSLSSAVGGLGTDPVGSRPSSTERERRRAPVLLRGGFGNFGASPAYPIPSSTRRDSSPAAPLSSPYGGGGEYIARAPFTAPGSVSSTSRDRDRTPVRDQEASLRREMVGSLGSANGRRGISEGPGSPSHSGLGGWTRGVGSANNTPVMGGRSGLPVVPDGGVWGASGDGRQRVPLSPPRRPSAGYTIGNTHIDPRARWAENRSNSTESERSYREEEGGGVPGEEGERQEVGPQVAGDDADDGIVGSMEMGYK